MNLGDFLGEMKKKGYTEEEARKILKNVEEIIVKGLKTDKVVKFGDLGAFHNRERKARKGINPQTKATLDIPAKNVVVFKESKYLSSEVK